MRFGPLSTGPEVDISSPLREITDLLGVDHECVKSIYIKPTEIVYTVYKKDRGGHKYIDPETDDAATDSYVRKAVT